MVKRLIKLKLNICRHTNNPPIFRTREIQVYRDDTTIIFAWKKESDEKEKSYLPQPQDFLNIGT